MSKRWRQLGRTRKWCKSIIFAHSSAHAKNGSIVSVVDNMSANMCNLNRFQISSVNASRSSKLFLVSRFGPTSSESVSVWTPRGTHMHTHTCTHTHTCMHAHTHANTHCAVLCVDTLNSLFTPYVISSSSSLHSDYSMVKDLLSRYTLWTQEGKHQHTPHLAAMMKRLHWMIMRGSREQEGLCHCPQKRKKEPVCHKMGSHKTWRQVQHSILNSMLSWTLLRDAQCLHLRVRCLLWHMQKSVQHNTITRQYFASHHYQFSSAMIYETCLLSWINNQLLAISFYIFESCNNCI